MSKGRTTFSADEAAEILALLARLRSSKKRIRDELRDSDGFYISDFARASTGFTKEDFQQLVDDGRIRLR